MDKLKSLLAAKKPQSKITVQKAQIQKQKQEYLKKEKQFKYKQQQVSNKRVQQLNEFYSGQNSKKKIKTDEQKIQIPLKQQQVKLRLKQLDQQQNIQNESGESRYKRLLKIQKIHGEYPQMDLKNLDMNFYWLLKQKEYFQSLQLKYRERLIQPKLLQHKQIRQKKIKFLLQQANKDLSTEQNYTSLCDQTYLWMVKLFRDWKQKLDHKYGNLRNNNVLVYQQTRHELGGFLKVLKNKAGDKDMIISVYHIMNCCLVRQYVQANDKYIDLSIGKAPWPMGVAMLSITVKRNGLKLSHVLNDQMTRKWMQSIKRLISVSQQLYPNEQVEKMVHLSVNLIV